MNLANEMAAEFVRQIKLTVSLEWKPGDDVLLVGARIEEAKVYDLLVRFRDRLQAAGQVVREDQ